MTDALGVTRSNLRWCRDGVEFTWWNGDILWATVIIDLQDQEIIAWRVARNAGITGSDVRDLMLETVERRRPGNAVAKHPDRTRPGRNPV